MAPRRLPRPPRTARERARAEASRSAFYRRRRTRQTTPRRDVGTMRGATASPGHPERWGGLGGRVGAPSELCRRQAENKARAAGRGPLDFYGAAVSDDDRAGDGEAEAAATALAIAGGIQAHERLEDPLGVAGIDAGTGVFDGDLGLAALRRD